MPFVQAALNGPYGKVEHPALPGSAEELAIDAAACVAAGAGAIHLHPRDADGRERLDAATVDTVVLRVRGRCNVPIGVSTGAWIEPDLERRVALVSAWQAPDYASLNVSEDGWERVGAALLEAGVGIEAGVWSVADAEALAASPLAGRILRVLVEPTSTAGGDPLAVAGGIHAALDAGEVRAPRLQHGDGVTAWILLRDALRRGLDTRIGFEDTFHLPDGQVAGDNAALLTAVARAFDGR